MKHKPNCSSNISCAVYHEDGKCPGYKPCDCGAELPSHDEKEKKPCPYCDIRIDLPKHDEKLYQWHLSGHGEPEKKLTGGNTFVRTMEWLMEHMKSEGYDNWDGSLNPYEVGHLLIHCEEIESAAEQRGYERGYEAGLAKGDDEAMDEMKIKAEAEQRVVGEVRKIMEELRQIPSIVGMDGERTFGYNNAFRNLLTRLNERWGKK